jgi:hypothetical protein
VPIAANTVYVVSYTAPAGRWAQTASYFTAQKTTGRLQGLANTASANGVSGRAGAYPATGASGANFWVDVVVTIPAAAAAAATPAAAAAATVPVGTPTPTPVAAGTPAPVASASAPASCPCSFSTAAAAPGGPAVADDKAIELGLRFRATAAGWLTTVRWYAPAATEADRVGSVWSGQQRLATVRLPAATAPGWQEAVLDRPVPVSAGAEYVVSYTAPAGGRHAEAAAPTGTRVAGPLTATVASGAVSGDPGTAPTTAVPGKDFWADVVVVTTAPPGAGQDTVAPTVTWTGLGAGTQPTITFSEAVTGVGMVLTGPDGRTVPGVLAYDPVTLTARLTPQETLRRGALYRVTVQGAKDDAGNVVTPLTWTFTVAG